MAGKETPIDRDDSVETAFTEFFEAWCSGEPLDPVAFCSRHPECGPALREKIDNFLLVARLFPGKDEAARDGTSPGREMSAAVEDRILGDYRILQELGRGGMGIVYEAEQIGLNRKVALKVLPPHLSFYDEAVKKFRREAEAGGRQTHPGIVSVYAVGEHEGMHYIAQELVGEGYTLADRLTELRKQEILPLGYFRESAKLIADAADALGHAHASGVIHRDVKPSNLLITREGTPKVTDFGLAKVEDALALSRTGDLAGTPYYMSPEQARGRKTGIDHRTDIFSLGVTLYEVLTLQLPFEGETSQEVLKGVLFAEPRDPGKVNARVPRDLAVICLKAMEKRPDDRYAAMQDLEDDLRRYLSGDVIKARPAGAMTKLWKRSRRYPALSGALVTAAIAVAILILAIPWYVFRITDQKNKAEADEERANKQTALADARTGRILSLADGLRLTELLTEADKLWPAYPEHAPAMEAWLTKAERFRDRFTLHQKTLKALRKEAVSSGSGDESSTGWVFASHEAQWQHDALQSLVQRLDEELFDEKAGMIQQVVNRLDMANSIYRLSIDDHQTLWDRTISEIADEGANPEYKGLKIGKQIGLVPIGKDPDSELFEFAHIQTGTIPGRGPDGALRYTEACGLVFVLIPGGAFNMGVVAPDEEHPRGSPNVDPQARPIEGPIRRIIMPPFFLSKYEMTQGQWLRFTGKNPSTFYPGFDSRVPVTLLHPVETINWSASAQVLARLGLRLPSEAEWEYAARAGTTTPWWTGEDKESIRGAANICDLTLLEFSPLPDVHYQTWLKDGLIVHGEVNTLRPNPFGLHHVIGNVCEWCRDVYDEYEKAPTDGSPYEGDWILRVFRGGGHQQFFNLGRSAFRLGLPPDYRAVDKGCRPARSIETGR